MKIKTFLYSLLLLFVASNLVGCGSTKPDKLPATEEEAQEQLAKKAKKQAKAAKKEQKIAYKHFWSLQSKEAKKSIKRNKKMQKRIARQQRKNR